MSDPGEYNLCACYLYYLRQSQEHCTETECYSPESLPGPSHVTPTDPTDFMMVFMFAVIGLILYMIRPKSLRLGSGDAKGADSDSDSSGEPPLPPPAVN